MTGAEHYREAEQHLSYAAGIEPEDSDGWMGPRAQWHLAAAQIHATLAVAAATAERTPGVELSYRRGEQWDRVLDGEPAEVSSDA